MGGLTEALAAIAQGTLPEGSMVVRTSHGSEVIELFGTNGKGIAVPVDMVDEVIADLEGACTDPETLYRFPVGEEGNEVLEMPGSKIAKVAQYLRQARDDGRELAKYEMIF
jgi:hypothetical protein